MKFLINEEIASMRSIQTLVALGLAGALLIAPVGNAGAVSASPGVFSRIDGISVHEFVQAKPKSETMKQKVKRVWRNMTGYKFEVACPAFPFALTRTTCVATGKNREDARAKCQSQHAFCQLRDSRR
jgi:hypothetical protein